MKLTIFDVQPVCDNCKHLHHDNQMPCDYCQLFWVAFDRLSEQEQWEKQHVGCERHEFRDGLWALLLEGEMTGKLRSKEGDK